MDDMISRRAAIDAIRASTSKYTGFMEMEMYTDDDAVEAIKALPSARRKGKWIYGDEMPDYPKVSYKPWIRYCSCCGEMTEQNDSALFDYCPWCGAEMNGGEDE